MVHPEHIFYHAGYCFKSPLGQSVFGNDGCVPGQVTLSEAASARVARVQDREALTRCEVDTSRTSLDIPLLEMRKALIEPALPDGEESACLGWQAQGFPLYAARDERAAVLSRVETGDTLLFQYVGEGDWSFIEIVRDTARAGLGWALFGQDLQPCNDIAG